MRKLFKNSTKLRILYNILFNYRSLGVLLYTLVYGAMPFDGSNFKRLVKQITTGDYYEPKKPSSTFILKHSNLTELILEPPLIFLHYQNINASFAEECTWAKTAKRYTSTSRKENAAKTKTEKSYYLRVLSCPVKSQATSWCYESTNGTNSIQIN